MCVGVRAGRSVRRRCEVRMCEGGGCEDISKAAVINQDQHVSMWK